MRVTYRHRDVYAYWRDRWTAIPVDEAMANRESYPLKYVDITLGKSRDPILEAGCGNGRIIRHLAARGLDVRGIDYIPEAIDKLRDADPDLDVRVGDVRKLSFDDQTFGTVLAFGLYHNLETGLDQAVQESYRVLKPGGRICASFRADNLQNRLSDWYAAKRHGSRTGEDGRPVFHKLNARRAEFVSLFSRNGFDVEDVFPVENMPLLYKFPAFRCRAQKQFDETGARAAGYQLSPIGSLLQRSLMRMVPDQWCNVFVLIGQKRAEHKASC